MFHRFLRLVMSIFVLVLVGCKTNTPMVRHHKWTLQTKLQAVHHWREFANGMVDDLQRRGTFEGCTFSVENSGEGSEFSSAFSKLLVSALIERGFKVAQPSRGSNFKIVIGHQIIVHGRRFGHCGLVNDITGRGSMNATDLGSGLGLAVRNWFTGDESGSPGTTRGEVLTTLWILKQTNVLYCGNQIAYFNVKDAPLYLGPDQLGQFAAVEKSRSGLFNWFVAIMGDDSRW
jgi:hypothetical protein